MAAATSAASKTAETTATPRAPALTTAAALARLMPPMPTTGRSTAVQTALRPSSPMHDESLVAVG